MILCLKKIFIPHEESIWILSHRSLRATGKEKLPYHFTVRGIKVSLSPFCTLDILGPRICAKLPSTAPALCGLCVIPADATQIWQKQNKQNLAVGWWDLIPVLAFPWNVLPLCKITLFGFEWLFISRDWGTFPLIRTQLCVRHVCCYSHSSFLCISSNEVHLNSVPLTVSRCHGFLVSLFLPYLYGGHVVDDKFIFCLHSISLFSWTID